MQGGKGGGRVRWGKLKERGSLLWKAREKDNFLALLLNKSVSIATIQPAAGEGGSGGGRVESGERGRGRGARERKRDRVAIATKE